MTIEVHLKPVSFRSHEKPTLRNLLIKNVCRSRDKFELFVIEVYSPVAALLVIAGAAVYPVGWDNREMRESCGNASHIYRLGQYPPWYSMHDPPVMMMDNRACYAQTGNSTFRITLFNHLATHK